MKETLSKRERKAAKQRQRRNRRLMWGVGAAGVLMLLVAAGITLSSQPSYAVNPRDPQLIASGKQVYEAQCASCHGANLEGEIGWDQPGTDGLIKAPPHNENGHTWHHNNAYLIESIVKGGARLPANTGTSAMPAYGTVLSPEEIGAVLSYIQSTWPTDIVAQQSQR